MALGVPGRLRPRIFSTFGTTSVVGHQPKASAVFTPWEIPGTHYQRLSRPQDTWFCRKEPRKKFQVTPPGIDPGTVRLVAQRLNHYANIIYRYNSFINKAVCWNHSRYLMVMYYMNSQGILRQASHTSFFSQISNFNSGCEIKNTFTGALCVCVCVCVCILSTQ